MEPLSALAIACATMQIISFGKEVYMVAKSISQDGSPNRSLSDAAAEMRHLSKDLTDQLARKESKVPLSSTMTRLQAQSKKCLEISESITELLDEIQWKTDPAQAPISGNAGKVKRSVVGQVARWWLKSRWRLKRFKHDLQEIQGQIELLLLEDVW